MLVWVIAVGNVANLLLVGAAQRERELMVRAALGAGRRRLFVQLLVEGLALAGISAGAAWIVGLWATRIIVAVSPTDLPRVADIQMNTHVFAFALMSALASAIIFGLVPALHASTDRSLIPFETRASARPAARRFRNGLIVGEIALALTVAVMAGLLAKSLTRLQHVSVGIAAEHVLTASVTLPTARYPRGRVAATLNDLLRGVETVPGVVAAGMTNSLPPDGLSLTDNFIVEDREPPPDRGAPIAPLLFVSDAYFRALGIPLVRGRWFDDHDTASSAPVAVISEAMAQKHFMGLDPIGRRLKNAADARSSNPWRSVVGVVADVKYGGLTEGAVPAFYVPLNQLPARDEYLVVRTTRDPSTAVQGVREALHAIDADLPLGDIQTMDDRLWKATAPARFRSGLMALFGVMALVLAAVGIYGVISFSVTQRTRELGVRLALGATRRDAVYLVVSETARLAGWGVAIGLLLAVAVGRFMTSALFAVSPSDNLTLIGMSALLLSVALIAGLVPAWRAGRTDPVIALRAE
jgi:predicted permease